MVAAYYRYSSVFVKALFLVLRCRGSACKRRKLHLRSVADLHPQNVDRANWLFFSIYLSIFLTNAFADTKEVTKLGVHDGTLASAELVKELRQLATFW